MIKVHEDMAGCIYIDNAIYTYGHLSYPFNLKTNITGLTKRI